MSKNGKKSGAHINRRGFLKGIAATGATGAIAAVHSTSAVPPGGGQPQGASAGTGAGGGQLMA